MKRAPVVSLILALAILGGFLAAFPYQWMLVGEVLLVLVTGQVILVRRHLYRIPGVSAPARVLRKEQMAAPTPRADPTAPAATPAPGQQVAPQDNTAASPPDRPAATRAQRPANRPRRPAGAANRSP